MDTHPSISGLGDDRLFANRRFAVECSHHYQAAYDQENRMVALSERFHHPGTTALRRRSQVTGYGLQRSGESVDLCILHGSMTTDQKYGFRDDLFNDHCSSVIERSAGANGIIYCGYPDNKRVSTDIGTGLNDPETELYYARNRSYNSIPGTVLRQEPKSRQATGVATRVLQRDPIGYAGGVNFYEYVGSAPAMATNELGIFAHNAQTATWGEIGSWAYLCPGGKLTLGIPAGLAEAEASIASLITRNRGVNFKPPPPPPPKGKFSLNWAAWQNIVAAGGGKDQTGGGNDMCVGSQHCWFVHKCYCCTQGARKLAARRKPLPPSGTVVVQGCNGGTLYFYSDPPQGWCDRKDYIHGCHGANKRGK